MRNESLHRQERAGRSECQGRVGRRRRRRTMAQITCLVHSGALFVTNGTLVASDRTSVPFVPPCSPITLTLFSKKPKYVLITRQRSSSVSVTPLTRRLEEDTKHGPDDWRRRGWHEDRGRSRGRRRRHPSDGTPGNPVPRCA